MNPHELWHSTALRQLEQRHADHQPSLMALAGSAIADWIIGHYTKQPIAVVAGPGNNGGDALIAAQHLQRAGWPIQVHRYGSCRHAELEKGLLITTTPPEPGAGILLDGLLGIGLHQAPRDEAADWIQCINLSGSTIIAIDVPSGLDSDTGHVPGAVVHAAQTLTLLGNKPGLHTGIGRDVVGNVHVLDLGVAANGTANYTLITRENVSWLPRRPHASHKGSFGTVAVIGGSEGMVGAALLAGRAALHAGTGKVFVGLLDNTLAVDPQQPELMIRAASALSHQAGIDVFAIGPGLGQSDAALALVDHALVLPQPLILDADALNLVSSHLALQRKLNARSANSTILTPHPAETARLLGNTTGEVQTNRITAAEQLRDRYQCTVVLKGSGSIIATPGLATAINGSGNGALAAAGQGDVLTGVIAALLAQGLNTYDAARLAVWAHGFAADHWRQHHPTGIGLTASETLQLVRGVLNHRDFGIAV